MSVGDRAGVDAGIGRQQRGDLDGPGDGGGGEELAEGRRLAAAERRRHQRLPRRLGRRVVAGRDLQVVPDVVLEDAGQLRLLDDHVPVPVAVPRLLRVRRDGDRVDVGLVGVVPVPAGQPERRAVPDRDLDVVGAGEDPGRGVGVGPGQRPRLREPAGHRLPQLADGGGVGLVRGRVLRRVVEHQAQLLAGQAVRHGLRDVRRGEVVQADGERFRRAGQEGPERGPAAVGAGAERDRRLRLDRIQGHAGRAAVGEFGLGDRRQLGVRRRGRRRMGTRQRPLVGEVRHRAQVRRQPQAGRVLLRVLQFQGLFRGCLPNVHRHPAHLGGQHVALRGTRDLVPDRDDDGLRIGQPVLRDLEAGPDGQHPGLIESRHVLLDDGIDVRQVICHISHPRLESGRYTPRSVGASEATAARCI